jgi:hypothetical protein
MSVVAGSLWRMNDHYFDFVIDCSVVRQRVRVTRQAECVRFECVSNYATCVHELLPCDYAVFVSKLGCDGVDVLTACRRLAEAGEGASVRRAVDRVAQTLQSAY